jgi:CRP-like cAMP-binding protein
MDPRKLKEKATEAFSKGKFAKAAELYGEHCQHDPKDLQARLRMGDAWAKAREKEKAIAAYRGAAEGYARDGFLPRAIAASKLILELDPAHKEVQSMLAELYARRTSADGKGKGRSRPEALALPADGATPSPMNRADAIDLPPDSPAPNPMNRPDAIDLPLESSAPSPINLPDAIDLPPDIRVVKPTGEPPRGKGEPIEIELDPSLGGEDPLELELARGNPKSNGHAVEEANASAVFDLSDELPPELQKQPEPEAPPAPPPEASEPVPAAEVAAAESPPPPPPAADGEYEIVGEEPAPAPEPEPIPLTSVKRRAPEVAASESAALQSSGRIWIPTPDGTEVPSVPTEATTSGRFAQPTVVTTPVSDLQAGLEALSRFDELELPDADVAFTPPPALQPVQITVFPPRLPPEAPPLPPRPRGPGKMPSFTELELEGDSLLHAVEAAARAGLPQVAEDSFSVDIEEPHEAPAPGDLPKIPLFSDLSPDAFIELFERCPLRRATIGERIIEQGSIGDSFFVICAGSVRVYRTDNGQRHDITTLDEGAFFGEVALLSDAPRTASVEAAAEDTQLLEISAPVLAQLSHRYPQVAQALKKFCRQRLLSNLMSSNALFRPFNKKDRRELIEKFRAREVQRGEVIIREGERSDGLYIVLSGETEVRRGDRALARLKEGEIFGEMSLLQKTPASATVSAAKRTSLLRLPRQDFDAVVLSHPQILVLISELTDDRRKQNEALLGGVAQVGDEGLLLV